MSELFWSDGRTWEVPGDWAVPEDYRAPASSSRTNLPTEPVPDRPAPVPVRSASPNGTHPNHAVSPPESTPMPTPIPAPAPPDQAAPPAGDEQQPFDVNEWQHIKTGNGMECYLVNVRTGFRTDIHKHMKDALKAAREGDVFREDE